MNAHFYFDGGEYFVEDFPNDVSHIRLPNGTVVVVTYWLESYPPQVGGVEAVTDVPDVKTVDAIEVTE